jgi:hypothetical protein
MLLVWCYGVVPDLLQFVISLHRLGKARLLVMSVPNCLACLVLPWIGRFILW